MAPAPPRGGTKAVRFFLAAVKHLEIPIAEHLTTGIKAASSSSNGAQRKRRSRRKPAAPPASPATPSNDAPGNSKTVALRSGGKVTLVVEYDPFTVSDDDQGFVLDLIQRIRKYGAGDDEEEDSS